MSKIIRIFQVEIISLKHRDWDTFDFLQNESPQDGQNVSPFNLEGIRRFICI